MFIKQIQHVVIYLNTLHLYPMTVRLCWRPVLCSIPESSRGHPQRNTDGYILHHNVLSHHLCHHRYWTSSITDQPGGSMHVFICNVCFCGFRILCSPGCIWTPQWHPAILLIRWRLFWVSLPIWMGLHQLYQQQDLQLRHQQLLSGGDTDTTEDESLQELNAQRV